MKQPRFKFGDKVMVAASAKGSDIGTTFVVKSIYTDEDHYRYGDASLPAYHWGEAHLVPYQEPQGKKLYAYNKGGEIKFLKSESFKSIVDEHMSKWDRAPEYDINVLADTVV